MAIMLASHLASTTSLLVCIVSSFEVPLGLTDVDLPTCARHFIHNCRLFLGRERVFDVSE